MQQVFRGLMATSVLLTSMTVNANNFFIETALINTKSTDLKSNMIEYGAGYKFNNKLALQINAANNIRSSELYETDSQFGISVRYTIPVLSKIDFYLLGGFQSMTISSSGAVADFNTEEKDISGVIYATGLTYQLSHSFKLSSNYKHNDGGDWNSSISSYSIGLSYDF